MILIALVPVQWPLSALLAKPVLKPAIEQEPSSGHMGNRDIHHKLLFSYVGQRIFKRRRKKSC